MQSFLPYPNFAASAVVLDRQRLGKQRIECFVIIQYAKYAKMGVVEGWSRHPAVLMWSDYLPAMGLYMSVINREWLRRGYESSQITPFNENYDKNPRFETWTDFPEKADDETIVMPPWLGDPAFHAAHRSQLLRKDPDWYGRWGWTEEPGALPYVWPGATMIEDKETA